MIPPTGGVLNENHTSLSALPTKHPGILSLVLVKTSDMLAPILLYISGEGHITASPKSITPAQSSLAG